MTYSEGRIRFRSVGKTGSAKKTLCSGNGVWIDLQLNCRGKRLSESTQLVGNLARYAWWLEGKETITRLVHVKVQ